MEAFTQAITLAPSGWEYTEEVKRLRHECQYLAMAEDIPEGD